MIRRIIKVFLASPGDLVAERRAAKAIVEEENKNHAYNLGYQLDLVGWEDTVAQARRAQAAINVELNQCDYFVGMMYKKWGSMPGKDDHPYTSGFEEEFRISAARRLKTGKPEMSLIFKRLSADQLADKGPDLIKVVKFREEIRDSKEYTYQEFEDDLRDFETKFRAIIAKFLAAQIDMDRAAENLDPAKASQPLSSAAEPEVSEEAPRTATIADTLETMVARLGDEAETTPVTVARFRLVATTLHEDGNDELILGNHDANLVFKHLADANLTEQEIFGLVRAGLHVMQSETAPLWRWLSKSPDGFVEELSVRTVLEPSVNRENAFSALKMLRLAIPEETRVAKRADYLHASLGTNTVLNVACLEYLGVVGGKDDLQFIEPLLTHSEANVARAAVRAKVRITAQSDLAGALDFAATRQDVDLGTDLTTELVANLSSIPSTVLAALLGNRTVDLVRAAAHELIGRGALTKENADALCESSDAETRFIAALELRKISSVFDLSAAKTKIVKPKRANLISALSPTNSDPEGDKYFERYLRVVLGERKREHLQAEMDAEDFFDWDASLAAYESHFKHFEPEIIENLNDIYNSRMEKRRKTLAPENILDKSVFSFVQSQLVQDTLQILCAKGNKKHLEIVRKVLDLQDVYYDDTILTFLKKNGDWEDVTRIIKIAENVRFFTYAFAANSKNPTRLRTAAAVILKLASKRIPDLLGLDMQAALRARIIALIPRAIFSKFDDEQLIGMFAHDNDGVRKSVALKIVATVSRPRLEGIMKRYIANASYYYNVIFWLDLGISIPPGIAIPAANRLLSET